MHRVPFDQIRENGESQIAFSKIAPPSKDKIATIGRNRTDS